MNYQQINSDRLEGAIRNPIQQAKAVGRACSGSVFSLPMRHAFHEWVYRGIFADLESVFANQDLILNSFLGIYMPFCYHCGKSIEEDWIVCPFCTKPTKINNSQHSFNLRDSVIKEIATTNVQNTNIIDNSEKVNVQNTNIIDNSEKVNEQTCQGCHGKGNIHPRLCNYIINDVKCTNYMCELCIKEPLLGIRMCIDCKHKCSSDPKLLKY